MSPVISVHRCRINFRWTPDADPREDYEEKVFIRAFQFARNDPAEIEVECSGVLPACYPYVVLESNDYKAVVRVAGKIERLILKLRYLELLP